MALLELTLPSAGKILAATLYAEATYAGLYEGLPTHESNNGFLAHLPDRVRRVFGTTIPVHVVEPDRALDESGRVTRLRGPVEYLPPYWFAAECHSAQYDESLVLVWFQDEPAPIPSEALRAKLEQVQWEELSRYLDP